jgi:nitroimidazol reductase NimA-like FMN-containing flavoprotein (pyridoxamine 5'-phosphate oxidase superfamily)
MPIRRLPDRAQHEIDQLYAVLDGAWVGTLSVVVPGETARVQSVPILYGRVGDAVIFHGSTGAGTLRLLASGAEATFCVSILDGFVYAASLFDSSANYRSAVVAGPVEVLAGTTAEDAVVALSERVMPGRPAEVRSSTRKELAATTVLRMPIASAEWTVKVRTGGVGDEPGADPTVWRGVLPVTTTFGAPVAELGQHGIPLSPSIARRLAGGPVTGS